MGKLEICIGTAKISTRLCETANLPDLGDGISSSHSTNFNSGYTADKHVHPVNSSETHKTQNVVLISMLGANGPCPTNVCLSWRTSLILLLARCAAGWDSHVVQSAIRCRGRDRSDSDRNKQR